MSSKYWFYVEPYVHVSCSKTEVLFYNTLDGSHAIFNEPFMVELASRLSSFDELYVVEVSSTQIKDQQFSAQLQQLRELFIADVVSVDSSTKKPVQVIPSCKVVHDYEKYKSSDFLVPINPLSYLNTVNLFVNYHHGDSGFKEIGKYQFLAPISSDSNAMLNLPTIKKIVGDLECSRVERLNVVIGNFLNEEEIAAIISYLNTLSVYKAYYILAEDYIKQKDLLLSVDLNASKLFVVAFDVDFVTQTDPSLLLISRSKSDFELVFAVKNDSEVVSVEKYAVANCGLLPYYTGENLRFFEDNVFVTSEDILSTKRSMKGIFRNKKLNDNFFGTVSVLPAGELFSNFHSNKLGDVFNNSIVKLIDEELERGASWRKVRSCVAPCSSCIYNALCPPISNYEHVLNRYNLCHVYDTQPS